MTQEDKQLLLVDLCGRLPYGVKFPMMCWDEIIRPVTLYSINKDGYCRVSEDDYSPYIDEVKPYLFPMSSMTEEQLKELGLERDKDILLLATGLRRIAEGDKSIKGKLIPYYAVDWCNKNHFDYRGLIPKGLATDCTNLNIY